MEKLTNKILYYAGKHPFWLLIPSIILSEIITMIISVPMSYYLFGIVNENLYIAGTCGFVVSLIVCSSLVYLARQSNDMRNEIEKLKRALNMNEDGSYVYKLTDSDFKTRMIEEMERGTRHNFSMIIMKIEIKNFNELEESYGKDNIKNIFKELNDLLNSIKRSYDLLTSDGLVYCVLLNQVIKGSSELVCKRFFTTVENHKFSIRKFDNMLTSNVVKLNISLAGLEFIPTLGTNIDNILDIVDSLLKETKDDSFKYQIGI